MRLLKTLAIGLTFSAAIVGAQAAESTKVTIVLSHATMAIGEEVFLYAVPKLAGFFEKEGLDVTIQGASGGVQAGQVMASGNAQFITSIAEGILQMREQGA